MRTISSMLESVQRLDIPFILESALVDSQTDYVRLQKDQMFHGLNSDERPIGQYKSPAYAAKKQAQNPTPGYGIPDLRLHGDFYAGIFADARSEGIVVDSADSKTDQLLSKYSDRIFTLGDTRLISFIGVVKPKVLQAVENGLNLNV